MSDVFEEVEESLRQDKASILWEKYGWILYVIGAMIVAAVAYNEWSSSQAAKKQAASVAVFEKARLALADGQHSEAEALFADIAKGGSDLAPLASHYLAQNRLEGGGDRLGAAAALTLNASSDDPFAKIAVLKGAYLSADQLSLVELEDQLAGLLSDQGPVGALALELVAAKAYEAGDFERARKEFSFLQIAPNAPQGVVARAEAALAVIPSVQPAIDEQDDTVEVDGVPSEETETTNEETGQ